MPPQNPLPAHHVSGLMKALILVFVLLLVGALGYMVWVANNAPDTTDNSGVVTKKAVTPSVVDPTANWKTYTNPGLKFSFKYPATFTLADALQASGAGMTAGQKLTLTDSVTAGKPSLEILVDPPGFDGSPTNLLYTFKLDANDMLSTVSTAKQTVDTSVLGDPTHYIAGTNLGGQLLNGKMFVIRYSYLTGDDILLTTFDEMIKTFKITK